MEEDIKKDNRLEDNDISDCKTTKEGKTTQNEKTTSTTHPPEDNNTKKDDITVMKTTLTETELQKGGILVSRIPDNSGRKSGHF